MRLTKPLPVTNPICHDSTKQESNLRIQDQKNCKKLDQRPNSITPPHPAVITPRHMSAVDDSETGIAHECASDRVRPLDYSRSRRKAGLCLEALFLPTNYSLTLDACTFTHHSSGAQEVSIQHAPCTSPSTFPPLPPPRLRACILTRTCLSPRNVPLIGHRTQKPEPKVFCSKVPTSSNLRDHYTKDIPSFKAMLLLPR